MTDKDNITLPREVAEHLTKMLEECPLLPINGDWSERDCAALTALRAALAAPEPEPAFWRYKGNPPIWDRHKGEWLDHFYFTDDKALAMLKDNNPMPLYTAAPPTAAPEPVLMELAQQMKPLDADIAAILYANLDSLYIEDEPAAAPEPEKERAETDTPARRVADKEKSASSTSEAYHEKRHPGYVIGNHWLETAYERLCAGEAEDAILEDYEVVREPRLRDLRRDAERLKAERDEQLRGLLLDIRKDSQSSHWHRDIVASMDALTALVSSAMDDWTAPAAAAVDASKQPATEPAIRAREQEDKT